MEFKELKMSTNPVVVKYACKQQPPFASLHSLASSDRFL